MKINLDEISVVGYLEFVYQGRVWRGYGKHKGYNLCAGTSPKGIWNDFSNGDERVRIYKHDLTKHNVLASIKLFNWWPEDESVMVLEKTLS